MEVKQHDWFATLMYQPNISIERMHDLGIMPSTASMKSRDEYKNIKAVLENPLFQNDSGTFDEKKFDNFYDSALLLYNQTAELEYLDKIESSFEYDPWAWYAANKPQRNTEPVAIVNPNPWRNEFGINGVGKINPGKFSAREIGQDQYYYDSEKGEFSDKKPNDFVGIFKSFKVPKLVLDTYDKDTVEIVNGKEVVHPKGSFKLNDYGAPYYRTLRENEEIYDKDLLHITDIWSTDGVGINKYDPFDSDGLSTEPWKVAVKNLIRVAPFLIGGEVGLVIKGLSAAAALFEFMPTFLKAVDGIATNNAMENDFGRKMNQLESWLARLDNSVSDRSREKFVTFENIGNLFADVTAQLFQQKAVARLPQAKIFKDVSWLHNNAKIGRALSYAYMSATSSKEAYSIFKNAGANDVTSGIAMLSLMGVYYMLMSSDYFKDVLFKGTWLDEANYKRISWNVLQDFKNATLKDEVPLVTNPETAKQAFNWFKRAWTKAIGTIPVEGKGFALGALSEGVEETMEEVGIDALKGLAAGMNALGIPVTVDDRDLDFGYSWDDVKTRYLTSFFGGAFGGAVFHGYNLMDPTYRNNLRTARQLAQTPDGRIAELVNLATQHRLNDVRRYATKLAKKGLAGNDSLSGTLFESIDSVNGKIDVARSSENNISQNELVYDAFMKQLNFIESILSDEGFLDARDKIAKALKLDKASAGVHLFESLGINDIIQYDVKRLGTQIVKLRAKMQDIADSLRPSDENYDKAEYEKSIKNNEEYKQYQEQLKDLRSQFDDLINAKNISRYVIPAVLVRNNAILKALVGYSNIDEYVQATYYGKHLEDFNEAQQLIIESEYEAYKSGEKKNVFELSEVYRVLAELMTNDIKTLDEKYKSLSEDTDVDVTTYGNQYIDNVIKKSRLYAEKTRLDEKEDKTDEDLTKIANISKQLAEIDDLIAQFKLNPFLAPNQVENSPIIYNSWVQGAKAILDHYNSLAGKFKYSDGELDELFYRIRRHYLDLDVKSITEAWISNQDIDVTDQDSFYRQTADTDVRKDFYNLLSRFYSQIWVDNEGARETYDAIEDLLRTRVGMTDEMIKTLLTNEVSTGQMITTKDENGVEVNKILIASLIPQIDGESILNYIDKLNEARSKIIYSDLSVILNKFSVATEDSELIDIVKAIQDEEFKIIGNLEGYRIGDPLIQSKLEKAQLFLKAIYAEIAGAGNGANKIINEYRNKEGKPLFAEISDGTRAKMLKHLNMLDNRIEFIKDLHAMNTGQKMRQQKEIGIDIRVKFLQNFKENVYIEEFKKRFFDPTELLESIDLDHITIDNFEQNEQKIIQIESEMYNRMEALHLTEEELAERLVAIFGKNSAWRQRSTKFNGSKKVGVTDYDQIVYAASLFSLHAGAFFYKERTLLEELQNQGEVELIPVFPQEHALRIIYSFAHNPVLFNTLMKKIKDSYNGSDNYIINKILLNNMISVFGGAGTGKTRGVGFFLSKFFDNVEFLFVGPTETQVKNLLTVFGAKSEQGKTFKEFFSTVAPQYLEASNFEYNSSKSNVVAKDVSLNFKDWWSTENDKVRILLVDEAGLANSHMLDVLSRYAEHFGAFAVTLGDTKQNTGTITWETKKKRADGKEESVFTTAPDGFEETVGIRTPPLKATFRAETRAKADNYTKLDHRLEIIDDKIQSSETPIESGKRDGLVDKVDTILDYYIYEDHISGDYITKNENEFKSLLDRLIEKGTNLDKILLVTDSETNKKYQDPKYDNIARQDALHAQGGEFNYVFIDKGLSDSKYDNLKDVYTISQRATLASIILDPKNIYDDTLGIKVHPRKDSDLPYIIPTDEKEQFITWRINALKHVEKPEGYEELIKILVNSKVIPHAKPEPTPTPTPEPEEKEELVEEKKDEEKKPETSETPTPEAEVKKEEKAEEKPVEKITPKEESEKPRVIPLVDSTKPVAKFVDKTPVAEPEEEYDYDEFNESTNEVPTWAASQDFFDLVFGPNFADFFVSETSNPSSLWTMVNNAGFKLEREEYKSVMLMLHRAVMNNIPIKDAIAQSKLKMRSDRIRAFKTIFQDENLFYSLWNINSDGKSNLTLVINNQIEPKFQHSIVVGMLKGQMLPNGRFSDTTKFKIYKKLDYVRNDSEWISIAKLKERYPWLTIYGIGGIPINSDAKQASSLYNERTKQFLYSQDGKLFGFANDSGELDPNLLLQTVTLPDGKLYLHNWPDLIRTLGIQRKVKPKEIAAYAAAVYYLFNKGYNITGNTKESLLNALIELGVVPKGSKSPVNDICEYLEKTTKNFGWYELIGLYNEKTEQGRSQYYDKLRKCCIESPVVTSGTTEKIATDLLGAILNNDTEIGDLSITNLYYEFTKKAYANKNGKSGIMMSKRAVLILNDAYMIRSRQEKDGWKLELYECQPVDEGKSYTLTSGPLVSYDLKAANFSSVLKEIISQFGNRIGGMDISQFNSFNVQMQIRTEQIEGNEILGYFSQNPASSLYSLFGYSFIKNSNFEHALNENRFKYGINGSVVKSEAAKGDQMAPATITDDMLTNASNWRASTYSFDGDIIEGTLEDPNTANRTILYNQAAAWLEELSYNVREVLPEFDEMSSELMNTIKKDTQLNDDLLEEYFNNFITEINTKLLEKTLDLSVMQFALEDQQIVKTILSENNDDSNLVKTYAYNNIIKTFEGISSDSTNEIVFSHNGVDVISNSDRTFVVYKSLDGRLQAKETKAYPEWKAAWDYVNGLSIWSKGSVIPYIFNLLTDTVTDSQTTSYMDAKYPEIETINRFVNNYLEKRLINEEC